MKLTNEPANKPVITTKYVIDNDSTIVSVFLDEDGDWQFFGNDETNEADARVISVNQILEIDNTLAQLPNLENEQSAFRNDKQSEWIIRS